MLYLEKNLKNRLPVIKLLTLLIFLSTILITPVSAAIEPPAGLDPTINQNSISNENLYTADPADIAGPSIQRRVACSQSDLIAAINAANASRSKSVIDLPPDCIIQVATVDNVDRKFMRNGFPVITSNITINANGAQITAERSDIRAFQVAKGGKLILNAIEIYGFNINLEGSAVVNLGRLQVNQSSLYNNQGRKGGAIYNEGEALFVNSTLTNNYSCCCRDHAYGGAIFNSGTLELVNSTLSNNRATVTGQTLYNLNGVILLKNTIITTIYRGDNCAGTPVTDGGGNLRWPSNDNSCVGTHGDPKLASLGEYGGLTKTMALLPGSKAIDTAVNAICASEPVNNTSQNGVTRPHGPRCDIGAFELDYLVVLSINRHDQNPTNAETVTFAVTFSQPVTGVDLSDFVLTTEGIDDAGLISVTGSGAEYFVIVNTGTKSGTLRLDLIDNDSITDLESNPLGGVGLGNGDFKNGEVYTIDKTPPWVVSINRLDENPNNKSLVNFQVTFSEPVTGVDISDFSLHTDHLINTEITDISGSGKVYIVTIKTGFGDGILRLDLIDHESIYDLVQNPLGGPGPDNGSFTTGEAYTIERAFDAPVAVDDSYQTEVNQSLVIQAPGVLSNDTGEEGQALIAILKTNNPEDEGTPILNSDGSFKYTPPKDWSGITTFAYTACYEDAPTVCSALAIVTIEIVPRAEEIYFNFIPIIFTP